MAAAVELIQSAACAATLLHPDRMRILESLTEAPDSASGLARCLHLPRQSVNYHLRELEKEGLVEIVEERRKRNCVERVMRASSRCYLISPAALGSLGISAAGAQDQFSAACLVSAASGAIRDISLLRQRAGKAGKTLATLTLQTGIRFASPEARREFTAELLDTIGRLAARYHDESAEDGRSFRLLTCAWPALTHAETADEPARKITLE